MSIAVRPNSLLAPHAWPGCALGYEIVRDGGGGPALRVTVQFDPARISVRKKAALTAWLSIRRHANDPSLEFAVVFSLQGEGAVGNPADTVPLYRALVGKLFRGVARGCHVPVTAVMTLPLNTASIASRMGRLSPLSAALTLARRRRAARGNKPAIWERVRSPLAPWLPPSVTRPASPVSWARAAEAALVGYDGAGGRIRLARPAHRAKALPELWALRWGGAQGVAFARRDTPAVTFAARPFAAEPMTGSVMVTAWNDMLTPETASRSFSNIDADAAFDRVMAILDALAAPGCAAALARVDPAARSRIKAARHAAARLFARQLIPILAGHDDADALVEVQHRMEQAVQAGAAGVGSIWVHLWLAVSEPAVRLRLGGVVSGLPSTPGTSTLPADILYGCEAPARLDFPVSPRTGGDNAALTLRPGWTLTEIECLDDADEARRAGRLVPLLASARDGEADMSLGNLEVPLTSRLYPEPAVLRDMKAIGPGDVSGQTLAELMAEVTRWSFAFTIDGGRLHSRDDAWFALAFNRPCVGPPTKANGAGTLTPLASGLLRFETGYVSVAPLLAEGLAKDTAHARTLVEIVAKLADDLAAVLITPPADTTAVLGVAETSTWVWRNRPNPDGSRSLFARLNPTDAADEPYFPTVAGCTPLDRRPAPADYAPDSGAWYEAVYHLPDGMGDAPLTFVLDRLDLLSRQTAAVSVRVVRNMGSGFNPLLARATGWTPLGPAVMPALDFPMPIAVPSDDAALEQSLETVLRPFCEAGDRAGGERTLRLELIYHYPLTSTEGEPGPIGSVPILSISLHPDVDTRPAEIATSLVEGCRAWEEAFPSSHAGAWVSLSAVLTVDIAETAVTLLALRQLDLPWLSTSTPK